MSPPSPERHRPEDIRRDDVYHRLPAAQRQRRAAVGVGEGYDRIDGRLRPSYPHVPSAHAGEAGAGAGRVDGDVPLLVAGRRVVAAEDQQICEGKLAPRRAVDMLLTVVLIAVIQNK